MKNVILIDTDNFIKKHFITKEKSDLSRPKKSLPPSLACYKKFPRRLGCNKQEKFRRLEERGAECSSLVQPCAPTSTTTSYSSALTFYQTAELSDK